jgi:hypothetical protein
MDKHSPLGERLERQLLKAQVVTRESLDDIKETSRVLREKTREIRTRPGRPFMVNWTVPQLPRAVPIRTLGRRPLFTNGR